MEADDETAQNLTPSSWQEATQWPWRCCWWLCHGHGGAVLVPPVPSVTALTPRRSDGGTEPCIPSLMCLVPHPGQCHGCHS